MNILLTVDCENNCSYCFARAVMADYPARHMELDDLDIVLDFLKKSGTRHLRLLGGEPMLHPRIEDVLERCRREAFFERITVFTGGLFALQAVDLLVDRKIQVLFNLNEAGDYAPGQCDRALRRLERLVDSGVQVTIGYNIHKREFEPAGHIRVMDEFGIRLLRWALANPSVDGRNRNLWQPRDTDFGQRLASFLLDCEARGIGTMVDCLVPPCLFDDTTRGQLELRNPAFGCRDRVVTGVCSAAIDVGPGLWVWHCFGLADHRVRLTDFNDLSSLRNALGRRANVLRWAAIPDVCAGCDIARRHLCQGGCLGNRAAETRRATLEAMKEPPPREVVRDSILEEKSSEELCERLFQLAVQGALAEFLGEWDTRRMHPMMMQYPGRVVLDAMAAEIRGQFQVALSLWRQALPRLKTERRIWVIGRIRQLRDDRPSQ